LLQKQDVLTNKGEVIEQQGKGRHDPCVVPRAVSIVEAMAALVIADYFLLNKIVKN
jgi:chorismate synthase